VASLNATQIKHIQNLLSKRGDYKTSGFPIAIDGVMGAGGETERAVKAFQRSFNPWRDKADPKLVFGAGQSPLNPDGQPGDKTELALRLFRYFGDRLSLNFHFNEFACGDGHCGYCGGWMEVPRNVLRAGEIIRAELFVPRLHRGLRVVGGSRCRKRNDIVIKGASNTQHLHEHGGNALDIDPYFTVEEIMHVGAGVTGYEIRKGHGRLVFHVDCRPGDPNRPSVFNW
jgi:hypothetical protein